MPPIILAESAKIVRAIAATRDAINGVLAGYRFLQARGLARVDVSELLDLAELESRDVSDDEVRKVLGVVQEGLDDLQDEIDSRTAEANADAPEPAPVDADDGDTTEANDGGSPPTPVGEGTDGTGGAADGQNSIE